MCRFNKIKSFLNPKIFPIFAVALFLGLFSDSIFGRYIFRYQITETFTRAEAEAMINRKVTATCFKNPELGMITSYTKHDDGQITVEITWDKPISGKFDKFNLGKETYRRCVAETKESE